MPKNDLPPSDASTTGTAPAPRRKRRHSQDVIALILEAAAEEFKSRGYDNATTAAIARKAATTEAQIFRYFGSKASLFRQSVFNQIDRHFTEFNDRHQAAPPSAEDLRHPAELYITELKQFLGERHGLLMSLLVAQTYAKQPTPGVDQIDALRSYFEHGAAMLADRGNPQGLKIDPALLVRISFGAVLASVMFRDWLFPPGLADDAQIDRAIIDFVIDGLGTMGKAG